MTHQLVAAAVFLSLAAPALAQELEVGGGWFQPNPTGGGWNGPRGPSIDLALTDWNGGLGWILGGTSIFGRNDTGLSVAPHVYAFVGGRGRWMNADGRGFIHVGAGAGPLFWRHDLAFRPEDADLAALVHRGGGHARAARRAVPARRSQHDALGRQAAVRASDCEARLVVRNLALASAGRQCCGSREGCIVPRPGEDWMA